VALLAADGLQQKVIAAAGRAPGRGSRWRSRFAEASQKLVATHKPRFKDFHTRPHGMFPEPRSSWATPGTPDQQAVSLPRSDAGVGVGSPACGGGEVPGTKTSDGVVQGVWSEAGSGRTYALMGEACVEVDREFLRGLVHDGPEGADHVLVAG
jgi:hypothetical protein